MARRIQRRRFLLGGAAGLAGLMAAGVRVAATPGLTPRARLPQIATDSGTAAPRMPTPGPSDPNWQVTGLDVPELASFDSAMKSFMRKNDVPGGALAVVDHGKLLLARGYAWGASAPAVAPDALFRIASLTKQFTSAAIFTLVQQGKLDLGATLSSLVEMTPPAGQTADPRLAGITVLQTLQHLGGWDRDLTFDPMFYDVAVASSLGVKLPISRADIVRYMSGQALSHDPGTTYSYSNYGYLLLGRVIEARSGMPYPRYVQDSVLAPLGISQMRQGRTAPADRAPGEVAYVSKYKGTTVLDTSGHTVAQPYGAFNLENMQSHGAWIASAVDLARFLSMFDAAPSKSVLSKTSMTTIFARPSNVGASEAVYYGCGWEVRDLGSGQRNIWHNGSLDGTNTLMVHNSSDRSWAVPFNKRDESGDPNADGAIDGDLQAAASEVKTWPSLDQFPDFPS